MMADMTETETTGETGRTEAATTAGGRPRWGLLGGLAVTVLVLDQLTKWWAVSELGDGHAVDVVGSLRFKLAYNTGSAFSLAQGRGALISLLALAVVAVLLRSGRHATRPLAALALGLVVGGAVGNLVDRAFRDGPGDEGFLGGAVVDFIDLQWWPVFNLADSAIVCGAILLVLTSWRDESGESDKSGDESSAEPEAGEPADPARDPG
jgi:signal peptidase II